MEERENVRPAEPENRPSEADVELHGVRPSATDEGREEGDTDDDVEAHQVRPS